MSLALYKQHAKCIFITMLPCFLYLALTYVFTLIDERHNFQKGNNELNFFFISSTNFFGKVSLSKKNSVLFRHDNTYVFIKVPFIL